MTITALVTSLLQVEFPILCGLRLTKRTFEVDLQQVFFVELATIVVLHLWADASIVGTDVHLSIFQCVSKGVDCVDDKLNLGVLFKVGQISEPEGNW